MGALDLECTNHEATGPPKMYTVLDGSPLTIGDCHLHGLLFYWLGLLHILSEVCQLSL